MPLYNPATGGGGSGEANLAVGTVTSTTVQVTSDAGTDATLPAATNAAAGMATAAQITKLEGIATAATANATNAQLRDRATHTGTQPAATISDFDATVDALIALKAPSAAPSFTGLETHAGTDLLTAAAMGADAIDTTKARNTKTVPASNPEYTFSGALSDGQEWGLELIGDTVARLVTIPSSRNVGANEDITTFVMPANGYAVLTWRRKGSVNLLAGVPGMKIMIPFAIETVGDGDYTIILKSIWAGAITNVTTKSASGTCTLTGKINTTALGGTANSVSSTESSQAHSATNVVAVGDDIVVTISANSTCLKLSGNIEMTVY